MNRGIKFTKKDRSFFKNFGGMAPLPPLALSSARPTKSKILIKTFIYFQEFKYILYITPQTFWKISLILQNCMYTSHVAFQENFSVSWGERLNSVEWRGRVACVLVCLGSGGGGLNRVGMYIVLLMEEGRESCQVWPWNVKREKTVPAFCNTTVVFLREGKPQQRKYMLSTYLIVF